MLYCHGDMKFNAPVSDMLVGCSVFVCVWVKVPDLQIYTKSRSILWLIKWVSNVKLSDFNSGSVMCVCVRVCVSVHIINPLFPSPFPR